MAKKFVGVFLQDVMEKPKHTLWPTLYIYIYIFFFLIGIYLLYNVVLVSAVQQSESVTCVHVPLLPWISFPFKSAQSTEWSSLCYTVDSH